jgi:long-chain acyl-CoA synthetase
MSELNQTIRDYFRDKADAPAIQFHGEWRAWRDVARLVEGLDGHLARLGIGRWVPVGCVLRNTPDHVAALIGLVTGERCMVTLNALLPDEKLAADICAVRPPVVLAAAQDWKRPALRQAVADAGALGLSLTGDLANPVEPVAGFEAVGAGPHAPAQDGVAILMLTSGTTGPPKRVPLKHAVLERQIKSAATGARHGGAADAQTTVQGAAILHGSLVHISGVWGVMTAVAAGRAICLLEKFSVPAWRAATAEHRPLGLGASPTALRMILDADIPREEMSSLRSIGVGTAGVDPALVDEFMLRYDLPVLPNYGATEFAGAVASWPLAEFRARWNEKRGAVGRVHKYNDARVVDPETGEVLPFGQEGILELKGYSIDQDGEWVRTSDRAVLDEERFLWIRGRADNAINRGGFKVQPDDVVAVLRKHPAVSEVSVVGIPDRRLGQAPAAAIVLKPGAERPPEAELEALVRAELMAYCVPIAYRFVDDLPRTPSLKVSMPAVRDLFTE